MLIKMRAIFLKAVVRLSIILALLLIIFPTKWSWDLLVNKPTEYPPSTDNYVPNLVHFIRFGKQQLTFIEAVCILSALKNQRPNKLYIHSDQRNFDGGKYWKIVMDQPSARNVVEVKYLQMPVSVFGKPFSEQFLYWHASDVERLRILIKYGGIYLDNDCYIVKALYPFFGDEMTLGWEEGGGISDQVLIAKRNARYLRMWLDSYKDYRKDEWFYNGGQLPTEILKKNPELVRAVKYYLAEYKTIPAMLYYFNNGAWKNHFAIHLLINHQYILTSNLSTEATYPVTFNETNILKYPNNLRQMALDVYPFNETTQRKYSNGRGSSITNNNAKRKPMRV